MEGGAWKRVKPNDWTSGFFPGCLWYAYELSGDTMFRAPAERWTAGLEGQKFNTKTHDVGFIMYCSYGNAIRLFPGEARKEILLQSARSLSTRFNPTVGCIRSWDNRKWPFPVIIDNMMNLELLFWAARNGGGKDLYSMAVSHAEKTMENHVREDGSTFHVVSYDSSSGAVEARETHQGYANGSTWSRGQAWGIYGFTMAYRETEDDRFLKTARRIADYFIAHLPGDGIPYWDFQALKIPDEKRDVSAAAIAASGLFELARYGQDEALCAAYRNAAEAILGSLCKAPYLARETPSMGILNHAVGNKPAGSEIDVSLIYADYYFLEALKRYSQMEERH